MVEYSGTLSVRQGKWKYIAPSNGGKIAWQTGIETGNDSAPQLYDLKQEAYERQNLYDRQPERGRRMQQLIDEIKAGKP